MNKFKTVYLCGPINGCSDSECRDWREQVKASIGNEFHILDPMRRDYRGIEEGNASIIVDSDLIDIKDSDIILVNANRPSWGTAMEMVYAEQYDKMVYAFCEKEPSPWLVYHSTALFKSMDECLEHIKRRPWLNRHWMDDILGIK